MKRGNEGTIDRSLRGFLGGLLLLSGIAVPTGGLAVQIVGVVLLMTAAVGWCPLYALLHLNTRDARS